MAVAPPLFPRQFLKFEGADKLSFKTNWGGLGDPFASVLILNTWIHCESRTILLLLPENCIVTRLRYNLNIWIYSIRWCRVLFWFDQFFTPFFSKTSLRIKFNFYLKYHQICFNMHKGKDQRRLNSKDSQ